MLWQLVLSLKNDIDRLERKINNEDADDAHNADFKSVPSVTSLIKYPESDILSAHSSMEEAEKQAVFEALARNNGNKKKAAEELKISLRTLYRKIQEYDL